jgi:hypothetical protein
VSATSVPYNIDAQFRRGVREILSAYFNECFVLLLVFTVLTFWYSSSKEDGGIIEVSYTREVGMNFQLTKIYS